MRDVIDDIADRKQETMGQKLSQIYFRAKKELAVKSADFADKFQAQSVRNLQKVEDGEWTQQEYQRWLNTQVFQSEHYKAMEEAVKAEILNANKTAMAYTNGEIPEVYAVSYNSQSAGISEAVNGYSFEMLNRDAVNALTDDVPHREVDVSKSEAWTDKHIKGEVTQGIVQGESVAKIATRLVNVAEYDRKAANRTARTMVTGAANLGRQNAMERAASMGIISVKEWMSQHDARTRDSHILLDGEQVEIGERFSNGLLCPAEPDGRPEEIYNCRCGMRQIIKGVRHSDGTVTEINLPATPQELPAEGFPEGYTYEQWKADAKARTEAKAMREQELAENETPDYSNKLLKNGNNSDINKKTILPINIQLLAKNPKNRPTIKLSKSEYAHVMSEISTNITESEKT